MVDRNFAAFILSHGRPDRVFTHAALRKCGYTGRIVFVLDNEDATAKRYEDMYPHDEIVIFDKSDLATRFDCGVPGASRKVIMHARNACWDIARGLSLTHFVQLDDDYTGFLTRFANGKTTRQLDYMFGAILDYLDTSGAMSIALSQGGDHLGGFEGVGSKRKAMNSFFCRTDRRFAFVGSINEDVNTYVTLGQRGSLFLTLFTAQLNQRATQHNDAGMTDVYVSMGTYTKSFYSVMYAPSCVKLHVMATKHGRIHHVIDWKSACPVIMRPSVKGIDIARQ